MTIAQNIDLFKTDIKQGRLNSEEIFQKHLIDGPSFFFQKLISDPSLEYSIKTLISEAFSVNVREIIIVGSAKLGFSLKPKNLFNEFDFLYSSTKLNKNRSDLDIAIVSTQLYENIGKRLYNYTKAYQQKWETNEYYSNKKSRKFPVPICYKYFEYYTKGWFRPDFKPQGFEFCNIGSYQELKGVLYKQVNRNIGIAIYQNWFYFMDYHVSNINNLKLKLNSEKI